MLGMEDCFNNLRPRTSTLKCISITGELLEVNYDELLGYVNRIDKSAIFMKSFIKNRENNRDHIMSLGRKRHFITESTDSKKNSESSRTKILRQHIIKNPKLNVTVNADCGKLIDASVLVKRDYKLLTQRPKYNLKNSIVLNSTTYKGKKSDLFKFTEVEPQEQKFDSAQVTAKVIPEVSKLKLSGYQRDFSFEQIVKMSPLFKTPHIRWGK